MLVFAEANTKFLISPIAEDFQISKSPIETPVITRAIRTNVLSIANSYWDAVNKLRGYGTAPLDVEQSPL